MMRLADHLRRVSFAALLCLLCAIAYADEPTTVPTTLPTTRAVLPAPTRNVYIDPNGRAILEHSDGDWRATAEAVFADRATAIGGAKILLIDRRHRIWLRPDADKDQTTVQMFDGKAWLTRNVSDVPAGATRRLAGIHFVGNPVEDAAGNVWLADGDHTQGWWVHQLSPDGKWSIKMLHERALLGANAPKKPDQRVLEFAEPKLQVGPDGLFYASWFSSRVDGGPGLGASGFVQFDGAHWSEYFYPTGSSQTDNVQSIMPLPDGSVGFVRLIDEPRVVWMTSALSRPVPNLDPYLDRLSSLSSREREAAQAELIAMGPRLRKPLEAIAAQSDDPEIKARLPAILQEISKPPVRGVYGGKYTFTSWRFLHQAASGRVYLLARDCKDTTGRGGFKEAMIVISPEGLWSAVESPAKKRGQPGTSLSVYEDSLGHRWYKIDGVGVLLDDGKGKSRKIADETDAAGIIRGADSAGRLYLLEKEGVVVLDPAALPPATQPATQSVTP